MFMVRSWITIHGTASVKFGSTIPVDLDLVPYSQRCEDHVIVNADNREAEQTT
jgi:hypothetical protein